MSKSISPSPLHRFGSLIPAYIYQSLAENLKETMRQFLTETIEIAYCSK
jgi:hypothetical protein